MHVRVDQPRKHREISAIDGFVRVEPLAEFGDHPVLDADVERLGVDSGAGIDYPRAADHQIGRLEVACKQPLGHATSCVAGVSVTIRRAASPGSVRGPLIRS